MSPGYRPEIDGLRAFAVLSVVLYHFRIPGFGGGFVGVDVFFVISGFLIGGLLWSEYRSTGSLVLRRFYIRRFRRLAPAYFAMALGSTALAWVILLPFEFREYGKALIAATVYLSNVFFYRGAGYFDTASEDKPLLHTWSLSVEEQFYIFLPLSLVLLARWPRLLLPILMTIGAGSLALCIWITPSSPTAAFYLFPFRAWELFAGVLLAIWGHERDRSWSRFGWLSGLGLFLIASSVVLVRPGPQFPGMIALIPVIGTLLVLGHSRAQGSVNDMLRSPVAVFFGLISYSLYLWHWPVLTLSHYLRDAYSSSLEVIAWMALCVLLAWVSWRLIENPIRQAAGLPGWSVLGGAALGSVCLLVIGGLIYKRDGVPDRFGSEATIHIRASADFLQDWSRCTTPDNGPHAGLEICPIGPDGPPRVLVWGDSHVRAMKEGLDLAAHESATPGLIIWRAGCPPLTGLRKIESAATPYQDFECENATLQIKQSLASMTDLDTVLLIGRWAYYASGTGVGLDAQNKIQILPARGAVDLNRTQEDLLKSAARATVSNMLDHVDHVAVLRQPPEIPYYDSRAAARAAAHAGLPMAGAKSVVSQVPIQQITQRATRGDGVFRDMAEQGIITWIDPWGQLCDDSVCNALHQETGYYFDNNHLTNSAAVALRDIFSPVLARRAKALGANE